MKAQCTSTTRLKWKARLCIDGSSPEGVNYWETIRGLLLTLAIGMDGPSENRFCPSFSTSRSQMSDVHGNSPKMLFVKGSKYNFKKKRLEV
mmetsp:Transcript_10313/g.24775  ORF Transcript_10313/g.24775 Transcript_10313/m.24775 type:complete len:91 (-) Transcript_10313:4310-4582(-)